MNFLKKKKTKKNNEKKDSSVKFKCIEQGAVAEKIRKPIRFSRNTVVLWEFLTKEDGKEVVMRKALLVSTIGRYCPENLEDATPLPGTNKAFYKNVVYRVIEPSGTENYYEPDFDAEQVNTENPQELQVLSDDYADALHNSICRELMIKIKRNKNWP